VLKTAQPVVPNYVFINTTDYVLFVNLNDAYDTPRCWEGKVLEISAEVYSSISEDFNYGIIKQATNRITQMLIS